MTKGVIYAGYVIYVEDDINGESRHLCVARAADLTFLHGRVGNVIMTDTSSMDKNVMYGRPAGFAVNRSRAAHGCRLGPSFR
jgi:hypothetical protein